MDLMALQTGQMTISHQYQRVASQYGQQRGGLQSADQREPAYFPYFTSQAQIRMPLA
jgi:hypothetical protein